MKYKMEGKGISLIVLVITIIIIIILAGAVILSLNNSNIIAKAKLAKESSDFTNIREALEMEKSDVKLAGGTFDSGNAANVIGKIPANYNNEISVTNEGTIIIKYSETPKITDITNAIEKLNAVYIPKGFGVSDVARESIKEEGLVIKDIISTTDTLNNEFVWVPVENYNEFRREDFNHAKQNFWLIETAATDGAFYEIHPTDMNNPVVNEQDSSALKEVTAMYASVKRYKGFYIARYEAANGTNGVLVSKKGKVAKASIQWGGSSSSPVLGEDGANGDVTDTYGAVYKSRSLYPSTNSSYGAASTLVYGVQWDAIMRWYNRNNINVTDSSTWGNCGKADWYAVKPTGFSESWKAKNIYDIAGNLWEWTMEAYGINERAMRGGSFYFSGSNTPASSRDNPSTPDYGGIWNGFRPALYIK